MTEESTEPTVRRIQDALGKAYEAGAQYDLAVQLNAEGVPDAPNTKGMHVRFNQFVLHCVRLLRPYLIMDLKSYWGADHLSEEKQALVYQDPDDENTKIVGLRELLYYSGATRQRQSWSQTPDSGIESQHREEAVLLPPQALRNALDLLAEAVYQLGFAAKPKKRRQAYNASVPDDDERASEVVKG